MQVLKGVVAIYPLYANKIYRTSVRRLLWLWWCVLDCTQSLSLLVRSNWGTGASEKHRRAENGNPVSRVVAHLARSVTRKGEKMLAKKRKLLTRNQPIECRSSCLRRTGTFKIGLLQFCAERASKFCRPDRYTGLEPGNRKRHSSTPKDLSPAAMCRREGPGSEVHGGPATGVPRASRYTGYERKWRPKPVRVGPLTLAPWSEVPCTNDECRYCQRAGWCIVWCPGADIPAGWRKGTDRTEEIFR